MNSEHVELSLPYHPPLDWSSLLGFLEMRVTPGVELVRGGVYARTIGLGGAIGAVQVRFDPAADRLIATVPEVFAACLPQLVRRFERIFDLGAVPTTAGHFEGDPLLGAAAAALPGIRVPGSWDGFETAVRAVLGQVISVKAATALAGRLVAALGRGLAVPEGPGLTHLFPTAERLAGADLTDLGLSRQKMRSITALAQAVACGRLRLDGAGDPETEVERLLELPGFGPWTAQYVAMRALGDPDAFPAGDLILRRAAAGHPTGTITEAELRSLAERWRPWRAYAAMLLWTSYSRPMTANRARPTRW